jgi:quinol monooxygenase YgiN
MSIVHVMAVITTKPNKRTEVLAAFNANVENVLGEDGCLEYGATVDASDVGDFQSPFGPDTFVVVEKWQTLAHLKAHIASPHMAAYAAKVKDLLAARAVHVLSPV